MKRATVLAAAVLAAFVFWFESREREPVPFVTPPSDFAEPFAPSVEVPDAEIPPPATAAVPPAPEPAAAVPVAAPEPGKPASAEDFAAPFVVEDGVAVVHEDIVIGKPVGDDPPEEGWARVPKMRLWPTARIPYHIQPAVENPARVHEALAMFEGTAVRFVPYEGQEDAIVFDVGTGHCKSYVGYIGGKQQIWLTPACGPREIAHEIMHALGFIHEQNRADRDAFVEVLNDNVDEKHAVNFELFPPEFMAASGRAEFDFESLMIYPTWMFAKGALPTMQSRVPGQRIQPLDAPSARDLERIDLVYRGLQPPEPVPAAR